LSARQTSASQRQLVLDDATLAAQLRIEAVVHQLERRIDFLERVVTTLLDPQQQGAHLQDRHSDLVLPSSGVLRGMTARFPAPAAHPPPHWTDDEEEADEDEEDDTDDPRFYGENQRASSSSTTSSSSSSSDHAPLLRDSEGVCVALPNQNAILCQRRRTSMV